MSSAQQRPQTQRRPSITLGDVAAWVCLIIPFVALLWVSSYARDKPVVWGFPFFFWYQLMWVFLAAGLTGIAYLIYSRKDARRRAERSGDSERGDSERGDSEEDSL